MVDMVPGKLSFDAGRDAIGRSIQRFDLKKVTVLGPDIEAAANATVRAHCFRPANPRLAHSFLSFRDAHDRAVASFRLDPFDDIDHSLQRWFRQPGEKPGMAQHRRLHQRVARAHGYAMSTRNAARLTYRRAAVPEHSGI